MTASQLRLHPLRSACLQGATAVPVIILRGDTTMTPSTPPIARTIKVPSPDHPVTIERNAQHVVVKIAGLVVADTHKALTLKEASYPPVQYIPQRDVDMALLKRTEHSTYCPYKGECAYYTRHECGMDVRTPPRRRRTYQGPCRVLSGSRRYDRRARSLISLNSISDANGDGSCAISLVCPHWCRVRRAASATGPTGSGRKRRLFEQ